jgi:hypothetical protein
MGESRWPYDGRPINPYRLPGSEVIASRNVTLRIGKSTSLGHTVFWVATSSGLGACWHEPEPARAVYRAPWAWSQLPDLGQLRAAG